MSKEGVYWGGLGRRVACPLSDALMSNTGKGRVWVVVLTRPLLECLGTEDSGG